MTLFLYYCASCNIYNLDNKCKNCTGLAKKIMHKCFFIANENKELRIFLLKN